jgi:hypothetical protein
MPKAISLAFDVAMAAVSGLWAGDKLSDLLIEHSSAVRAISRSARGVEVRWRRGTREE